MKTFSRVMGDYSAVTTEGGGGGQAPFQYQIGGYGTGLRKCYFYVLYNSHQIPGNFLYLHWNFMRNLYTIRDLFELFINARKKVYESCH